MTFKLVKYEFRSMLKQFSIVWPAALILALINGFSMTKYGDSISMSESGAGNILMIVFVCVMMAIAVISAIFIISRFNTGLLKDEGYLMFTLPVTPTQLVGSKLISAIAVIIISSIVGLLSILLLLVQSINLGEMFSDLGRLISMINQSEPLWWLLAIEALILSLCWTASSILSVYMCIAIGHLAKRHRTALAVITYIVLGSVTGQIVSIFGKLFNAIGLDEWFEQLLESGSYIAYNQAGLLMMIGLVLVISAIYYVVTVQILSKKLNIE